MTPDVIKYGIIIVYLAGIAALGILMGGKERSVKEYFLGANKVNWLAVCFAIVAAETSTLTFISIPGLAYATNLGFLQVTFGYLLGRVVVSYVLLPSIFAGDNTTAYGYLENRFGKKTRSLASAVFIFTRVAADGVRLFATAIPIKLMLGISYPAAVIIIAVATFAYTYTGGIKGVIWVDAVQMFIYLGGAIISGYYLLQLIPGGWSAAVAAGSEAGKLTVINWGFAGGLQEFFSKPYTVLGGLIGGGFLSMASHGTDQLIVQRVLATGDLRRGRKALIGSGIIVILQFLLFLLVGVLLFTFYGKMDIKSDEIFPMFILQQLPPAATGIIVAGLLAAAMSTLAGSITSLSASSLMDLYLPLSGKALSGERQFRISRVLTVVWTVVLICSAYIFMGSPKAVVELALSIASFTYGGLLGTFLLGRLNKRATQEDAIGAFLAGIFIMIAVISLKAVAWTWFTVIGVATTLLTGYIVSRLGATGKEQKG